MKIAVLGAGPAGLATARLLHLHDFEVTVYERDTDRAARTQGGSLDLGEDYGLRTLAAAGLMDAFTEHARPQGQHTNYFDIHGNLLLATAIEPGEEYRPEIDRLQLRSLLLDSLPDGTVHWGHDARAVDRLGDRWRVSFANGRAIDADLVIGADGINSATRPVVTDEMPAYTGVTLIAGEIAEPLPGSYAAEIVGEGAGLAFGADKALLCQRNGDGSIRVYFAQRRPLTAHEFIRAELDREMAGWSPRMRGIIDEVQAEFVRWPLYVVPARQQWRKHVGLTLVGDAAHVVPPYTGQGVNMGLVDALELVTALTSHSDVDRAIAVYEKEMLARMEPVIDATMATQDLVLSPNGPTAMLAAVR